LGVRRGGRYKHTRPPTFFQKRKKKQSRREYTGIDTHQKRHFFWSVRSVTLAPPRNKSRDDGCWWFLRSRDAFVESQQKTVVAEISVSNADEQKRRAKVIVVGVDQKENDDVDEE
jgi:hypothetical protein